eukprot:166035_1
MIPNTNDVLKQGYLYKKSKYIGQWRLRWTILTDKYLYTFKNKNIHRNPTEIIQLSTIDSVLSSSDKIFQIALENTANNNNNYAFKADEKSDKIEWMDHINKFRNKCIKIPINIECKRNVDYQNQFQLSIPYYSDYNYSINRIIEDIIQYIQRKFQHIKFTPIEIKSDSFIGQKIIYNDYDWNNCFVQVTDYPKQHIIQNGIHLLIDVAVYKHNVINLDKPKCPNMKNYHDLCPIYGKVRYQDLFEEEYLFHLNEYKHFNNEYNDKPKCKFGEECYSYKRVVNDGCNELKDRTHITLYRHPPRLYRHPPRSRKIKSSEEINSFHLNDIWIDNTPLYRPNDDEKKEEAHVAIKDDVL